MAPFSLVLGVLAVLAALAVRREVALRLGSPWLLRFLLVQAGVINLCTLALVSYLAGTNGWNGWGLAAGYAVLFFFYSVANIDWTVKKFHAGEA